ncbi:MAG: asparagine synthase (glutamine-hydrolyzing), partial [Gemmatimonadota bacterium]|nr:asparagine synthase (glutamine-hydrolyzing) [Gemmatimonadota bacterium]
MCGIVGVAGRNEADPVLMEKQCGTIVHRGPDQKGQWGSSDGHVIFGFRRLSIIDLSPLGNQPMVDSSGRYEIVMNGEIYNYRELKVSLEREGVRFRSASDTEVLLESFRLWGEDCCERINGMFAFAIYDTERRRLFLARDRAGEKPLFYYERDGRLIFASELKAIMADPAVPRRMNAEALDHYVAYGYVPGSLCLLDGVKKLPAGHCLSYEIDSSDIRVRPYWTLPESYSGSPDVDPDNLVDELESLFADSVRRQLVADVPVGLLLSGGLDSSLVVGMAARVAKGSLRTFNISFPGHGVYDEGPYAREVAKHFKTDHTELVAEPATVSLLPELARQYDEPVGDSSMVPTYLVSRLVREKCTVALAGDGGDELFAGYLHYSRIQTQLRWRKMMPRIAELAAGHAAGLLPTGVRGRTYLRSLVRPVGDAWVDATLHFDAATRRGLSPLLRAPAWESPEARRLSSGAGGNSLVQKMTRADFRTYLPDDILAKVDRASMLASLEVRAPFLDRHVIEFAFGKVPDHLRATETGRKILLRKLARRILPPTFDVERKQGFSLPLDKWFRGDWG